MATTVNTKGQVTIPVELRKKYSLTPGTKVVWVESEGHIYPIPAMAWKDLQGYLKRKPGQPSMAEMLLRDRTEEREREDR